MLKLIWGMSREGGDREKDRMEKVGLARRGSSAQQQRVPQAWQLAGPVKTDAGAWPQDRLLQRALQNHPRSQVGFQTTPASRLPCIPQLSPSPCALAMCHLKPPLWMNCVAFSPHRCGQENTEGKRTPQLPTWLSWGVWLWGLSVSLCQPTLPFPAQSATGTSEGLGSPERPPFPAPGTQLLQLLVRSGPRRGPTTGGRQEAQDRGGRPGAQKKAINLIKPNLDTLPAP